MTQGARFRFPALQTGLLLLSRRWDGAWDSKGPIPAGQPVGSPPGRTESIQPATASRGAVHLDASVLIKDVYTYKTVRRYSTNLL